MVLNDRCVRQVVCRGLARLFAREVIFQVLAYALKRREQADAEMPALKSRLHITDQRLPLLGAHGAIQRPVGHDFDGVVATSPRV